MGPYLTTPKKDKKKDDQEIPKVYIYHRCALAVALCKGGGKQWRMPILQ